MMYIVVIVFCVLACGYLWKNRGELKDLEALTITNEAKLVQLTKDLEKSRADKKYYMYTMQNNLNNAIDECDRLRNVILDFKDGTLNVDNEKGREKCQ